MKIERFDASIPDDELYAKYPGQTAPQPVYLEVDLEDETAYIVLDEEIGDHTPERVYSGRCVRYGLPPGLLPAAANRLLDGLADSLQRRCDAEGDDDAEYTADVAIERAIEDEIDTDHDCIYVVDAADWFDAIRHEHVASLEAGELTLEDIRREIDAAEGPEGQTIEITGTEAYINDLMAEVAEDADIYADGLAEMRSLESARDYVETREAPTLAAAVYAIAAAEDSGFGLSSENVGLYAEVLDTKGVDLAAVVRLAKLLIGINEGA